MYDETEFTIKFKLEKLMPPHVPWIQLLTLLLVIVILMIMLLAFYKIRKTHLASYNS